MDAEILFSERQKFRQWWLWLILLAVNALLLSGVYKQIISGQSFGEKPMSNTELLMSAGLILLLTLLLGYLRLDTLITKEGVYVRFFPFQLSFRQYPWNKIPAAYVKQYDPISEYGGWGLRFGLFGKGKAYNVSGDKGLQLEFLDNTKLLIGTNKPDELAETLNKIRF